MSSTRAKEGAQADVGSPPPHLLPQRISRAVEHAAPWLVLAGSGGVADVLAALMNQPHLLVPQVAEKQFKEKFPGEQFRWEDIVHWTKLVGASQRRWDPKAEAPRPVPSPAPRHGRAGTNPPGASVPPPHTQGPSVLHLPTEPPSWLSLGPRSRGARSGPLCPGQPLACSLRPTSHAGCPAHACPPACPRPQGHLRAPVLVSQLQNITCHPHLLTVHDFEQEGTEELDTVILKALVKGERPGRVWGDHRCVPRPPALRLAPRDP